MSGPPRDWDKELAKIDRAIARLPDQPGPAPAPQSPSAPPTAKPASPAPAAVPAPAHVADLRATTTTWLRVLLVLTLAGAMPFWPYPHGCGFGLFAYLGASLVVVIAGAWASISTWHRRRPVGHILALLVLIWGLGLIAAQVLPRVGYAKAAVRWTCG